APVPGRVFEIGFGEGFELAELERRGWKISGVDFTDEGARMQNPDILDRVVVGDVFDVLDDLVKADAQFDLLICNNVLEHVPDPERLAESAAKLVTPEGVARFVVPNDGSVLQKAVVDAGAAPDQFWVRFPDHLNYFTTETAPLLLHAAGWEVVDVLGAFPIDFFLFNPETNYVLHPERGKPCHRARLAIENALAATGIDRLIQFRRGCAAAGIGRDVVVYARTRPE
ncbi:MAG: class I SAM-dependent methyltransferase, partial [Acidimicrobiales bacterium]|nr:class I SAM-dependent methyltransferase [Acidimicrobiales bacterium]